MVFVAELSGLEVLVLTKEIESGLRDTYVNNIFRIGEAQIIRFRGQDGNDVWLVTSPKVGVWLSEKVAERGETTEFTTSLRKLLGRARFKAASQVDLDRIFVLEMESTESMRLVVELMPPGNLIVTDAGGRILAIKNEVRSPRRRLVRGGHYEPPRQTRQSPGDVRVEDVQTMVKAEKTAGQAIGKHISLPRKYVVEVLSRLALEEGSPSTLITGREPEVVGILRDLVDEATSSPTPCLVETDGIREVFVVRPVRSHVVREADSVSSICDEVLLDKVLRTEVSEQSDSEKEALGLAARITKLEEEAESYKGQALKARALAVTAKRTSSTHDALEVIQELGIKIREAPSSPEAVASIAFDRAKELDGKAVEVARAVKKLRAKAPREGPQPVKRRLLPKRSRQWYEKFRWFRTSAGKLAIGGRDAASNSILVRRHLDLDDSVYHASLLGSPFFILKGGREQTEDEVREVAQATVAFSSAWKTGLGSAEAFWVNPDQVKTAAPSGEYLARGSFAISGRKNQVSKIMMEIAIGETGEGELTAAPEASFKGGSHSYLVLRPQREKSSETAKRVLKDLASMVGDLQGHTVDDVIRVLPSGGGKVVRRVGSPRDEPKP